MSFVAIVTIGGNHFDNDNIIVYFINKPVFLSNTPRPHAAFVVFQIFWFARTSHGMLLQFIYHFH